MMTKQLTVVIVLMLAPGCVLRQSPSRPRVAAAQEATSRSYELRGGRWFDGAAFVRRDFYVRDGVFSRQRPPRVDSVINLADAYIVPPFADAHTHAFDNPESIEATIRAYLAEGIFYALVLTNSIAGKRAVASRVNHAGTMDVAYADAGLTSSRGHPIMSAEMAANRWSWDSLGAHWGDLLRSRKAEGDVYFVIDSVGDVTRQWTRIVASHPDLIKIYLIDVERYDVLDADRGAVGNKGLPPSVVPSVVRAAHQSGLRVAAHVETAADFHLAVTAGVEIIAHLPGLAVPSDSDIARYSISAADAALAAQRKVTVITTAWLASQDRISRGDSAQVRRTRAVQRANLRRLAAAGVPLAVGADLFVTASHEAEYLMELGVFDAAELLRMWSQTTAWTIFPARKIGRLSDGNEASFLALACNPLTDWGCTRHITVKMKQGHVLPPGL